MKMTYKTARMLYNHVRSINREISFLNYGGCGVFAVEAAKMLTSLGFENVSIVGIERNMSEKDYFNTNLEYLRNAREENIPPRSVETYDHYVVKCGNWYLDSQTAFFKRSDHLLIVDEDGYKNVYYEIGEYTIEDLEYANKFQFLWNRKYDRRQNKFVKTFIKNTHKKLENVLRNI